MDTIKILYVDDEELNLRVFYHSFKRKYTVLTAYSGEEALKKLEDDNDIQVVISDMKMPEMNGIEFIKLASQKFKDIVYFILTGFEITPEIKEALKNEMIFQYFKKPFNSEAIENSIQQAIIL